MTTLREAAVAALEALELSTPKARNEDDYAEQGWEEHHAAITALKAALAEPQDEPVAKVEVMTTGGNAGLATRIVEIDDYLRERLRPGQMLYTHPAPQRQPLSDEEIDRVTDAQWAANNHKPVYAARRAYARAIEQAHGIGGKE